MNYSFSQVIQSIKKRRRCCDVGGKGCSIFNPKLLYGASYFGATCLFLFSCNLTIFYDLHFPMTGSLLAPEHTHMSAVRMIAVIVMWGIHFFRHFGQILFKVKFDREDRYCHWSSIKLALCSLLLFKPLSTGRSSPVRNRPYDDGN